jgi:hypothetical protein
MALDYSFKPFSGVGIMSMYRRNAATGLPLAAGYDLGEGSKLSISQNVPKVELNTSRDTQRGVAFSMAQSKAGSVSIELRTISDPVLALLMAGTWTEAVAGSAVVGWVAPAGTLVNEIIKLPAKNLSAVVVKDSAGSPATVPVAKYNLDAVAGTLQMLDITGYVLPFKVDYTPGAIKTLGAFKAADEDLILLFNGTNAQDGSRAIIEVFKFRPTPEGEFGVITTEYGTYQINGSIQKDETKQASSAGGQYFSWVQPNP